MPRVHLLKLCVLGLLACYCTCLHAIYFEMIQQGFCEIHVYIDIQINQLVEKLLNTLEMKISIYALHNIYKHFNYGR